MAGKGNLPALKSLPTTIAHVSANRSADKDTRPRKIFLRGKKQLMEIRKKHSVCVRVPLSSQRALCIIIAHQDFGGRDRKSSSITEGGLLQQRFVCGHYVNVDPCAGNSLAVLQPHICVKSVRQEGDEGQLVCVQYNVLKFGFNELVVILNRDGLHIT